MKASLRSKLRTVLHAWLQDNPDLFPMLLVVFVRWVRGRERKGAMMSNETACDSDPTPGTIGPARGYEAIVGTLVSVAGDHGPVVEFDGPVGECRQRTALALTPVEGVAVGHPVELTFVEGDLDRPVITKIFDWKTELWARWAALGRKVLRLEPGPWKLEALVEEFTVLACVVAWFTMEGNITHAANLVGTSRKVLRERITAWKKANPRLVPVSPAKERKAKPRKSRRKARKPEAEGHAPAPDGGGERSDGSVADG